MDDLVQEARALLAACRTVALATVDEAGHPHAANVQVGCDEQLRLVWVSKPDAAHSRHLAARPRVAVTVYHPDDRPEQIRGVQMHGTAEAVAHDSAWPTYLAALPFVGDPPYREAVARQQFYRFTPTWLRWIDNRRGFGHRVERTLS
jgi:hypothetical protein